MKKITVLLLSIILCFGLVACGEDSEPQEEEDVVAEQVEENETEENDIDVPGIDGSQAYDIILSLEDTGIPKADTEYKDDGMRYTSTTNQYSYDIEANEDFEVMCATFMVLSGSDDGYLGFCGSMPYDAADPGAQQWVNDNIGTEATQTFGDATYTLSVGTQGPILTIKADGYDEYTMEKIKEATE